jgi:LEA14-like dessication related protein
MKKKWLFIFGGLLVVGGLAYAQYRRLMNFKISVNRIKINKLGLNNINLDMVLNFQNNSSAKFTLINQSYNVYINDVFAANIVSKNQSTLYPNKISPIAVNIKINPSDFLNKINLVSILQDSSNAKIKIDSKLKISAYGITFNAPFVYESTIKEMMQ